ncbi:uncharacterized protein znf518a [Siphateles boraxobius]|uniref:uncharacterized protein znf518a n=1 Tax=Siphateles boraxobius TaxID=180520 RepID=UPI00406445EF
MNRVDAKPDAQVGNEKRNIWHKRLRLRKSSFSFPNEQNTVKEEKNVAPHGQKETKTFNKRHLVNTFICSACNDGISFTPGELMMHFTIVHGGKGSPPMFPCNVCGFSTSVFTTLQQHRMHHKDCLFTCEICNDNVQQTLPQLTKHCQTHHSLNGQYYCPKCKLSIQEIEQFICHSCSAPIISNREESIKLRAAQKNNLLKHMAAACRQRWSRRNWWRKRTQVCKQHNNPSQEFEFLLPKPEPQWASQLLPLSTPGLLDNHGLLMDPEKTLEETQQFLERTVSSGNKWPISLKSKLDVVSLVPTTPCPSQANAKRCNAPHPGLRRTGKDKLTGLMEKNNISVPPDCTTKVVGFKMVDGKNHLVLKVIPSNKQDVSTPRELDCVEPHTVKPIAKPIESNDTSTVNASGNCSHAQVTSRRSSSQSQKCVAQRDFLSSVVERIKSQQKDGCNNQEPTDCDTHINLNVCNASETKTEAKPMHSCTEVDIHAKRVKDCQDKAVSESEENFPACQGDSGCHSDLTSDTGSLEERCSSRLLSAAFDKEHNLTLDANLIGLHSNSDSCSISGFDCISPSSRSPLKDLAETLCHFRSEDEGLLFHSRTDECTNNTDPRDSPVPVGQHDCERETAPDLDHTVPLTTSSHSLEEARVDQTISDEPLPDLTCTGGPNQQSKITFPDDSNSSTCVSRESSGPLASLNRKRMGETSSPDSPISKSQKCWTGASGDVTASDLHWQPVARDVPTTLRLIPYSSSQSVQIPRDNQPVIVLNHPDTEIPEVANIMKVVHKHKDAVQRVVLSRKTLRALSHFNCDDLGKTLIGNCHASHFRRDWPNGTVKERFSLKLRLKRVCGRKYTVVPAVSESFVLQPTFRCWFCGRIFRNQEAWVGHGQRHLMEATRGWEQLFNR